MLPAAADILLYVTEAVKVGLKEVPVLGSVISYQEQVAMGLKLRDIFARFATLDQRVAALESVAALSIAEVEAICQQQVRSMPAAQQQYVTVVVRQITQRITRKMTSTKRLGAPRFTDDEAFYRSLVPERRPHDYTGQEVPHRPRWIMRDLIGSGGMGEVWRAKHATLPEYEAIKFCHEKKHREFLQREVTTLQLVQKLPQHPNIVRLKDVNLDKVPYWLAFEYVAGGTLLDLMQQRYLAWGEALGLMTQIVDGVAAAHALRVVHRDLKPANILLTADGVPKVTDFGLGKVIDARDASTQLGMGTQDYASPEQVAGKRADPSDDVYALGVIFWRLTVHPMQAPQFLDLSLKNSRLPETARQLIGDCLKLPRGQRPANAGIFLQRLRQLPATLAIDAGLDSLRQEADQARSQAQQIQARQFVEQLKIQEQKAQQLRQEQTSKSQSILQSTATTIQPGESLAEQWQAINDLTAEMAKITATFVNERTSEQQRIEQIQAKALKDLGDFRSEPRDEEFELLEEYQTRLAREKTAYFGQKQAITDLWQRTKQENLTRVNAAEQEALDTCIQALSRLPKTPHRFQYGNLTDWRYDLNQQTLHCQKVIKSLLPLEQIRLTIAANMSRDHAQYYRTNPESFQICGQLELQAKPPAIMATTTYLELSGIGRFPAQVKVAIEPDREAIISHKFSIAMKSDTEVALENFLKDYPDTPEAKKAAKKLDKLKNNRSLREWINSGIQSLLVEMAFLSLCALISFLGWSSVFIIGDATWIGGWFIVFVTVFTVAAIVQARIPKDVGEVPGAAVLGVILGALIGFVYSFMDYTFALYIGGSMGTAILFGVLGAAMGILVDDM